MTENNRIYIPFEELLPMTDKVNKYMGHEFSSLTAFRYLAETVCTGRRYLLIMGNRMSVREVRAIFLDTLDKYSSIKDKVIIHQVNQDDMYSLNFKIILNDSEQETHVNGRITVIQLVSSNYIPISLFNRLRGIRFDGIDIYYD